jgi:hypothetical protein
MHGEKSLTYARVLSAIGINLLQQNRLTDAEISLRDALAIRKAQAPDDWVTFKAESLLGEVLTRQAKFEEAEPRVIAGYEGLVARKASIPIKFREELAKARRRIVDYYEASGQPAKGQKWKDPPVIPQRTTRVDSSMDFYAQS